MIDQPPAEVDVRAILEALVEAAERVECGAREGKVERGRLLEVLRSAHPLDLELVMGVRLLRSDGQPGGHLLPVVCDRRHHPGQPVPRRPTSRVDEDDHLPRGRAHTVVALMRDRDSHPWRRAVVKPADRRMAPAHPLQSPLRGVDHDQLTRLRQLGRLGLDRGECLIQVRFVLADHNDGYHDVKASATGSIRA